MTTSLIATQSVAQRILLLRGQKVMLDADLAELFDVPTKRFNEQVKRNLDRFPSDFMFQLTEDEDESLRSQIATSNTGRGGRRYFPYAFTEHGAIMAATILNSPRAVEMSVFIVRAFVQLREMVSSNTAVADKLLELERKLSGHDQAIAGLVNAIRQLMMPSSEKSRPIGFTADIGVKKMRGGAAKTQRGFSLISAIFLLVVIAALGTFAVTLSTTQQQSSAMDVMGARAYQAARAGIEWGAYQVLRNAGACAATTPLPAGTFPGTLSGFTVIVACSRTQPVENGAIVNVYQITSTARQGTALTAGFVERQISATIAP